MLGNSVADVFIHNLINIHFCEHPLRQVVVGSYVYVAVDFGVIVVQVEFATYMVSVSYLAAWFVQYHYVLECVGSKDECPACARRRLKGCIKASVRLYVLRRTVLDIHNRSAETNLFVLRTRNQQDGNCQKAKTNAMLHLERSLGLLILYVFQ